MRIVNKSGIPESIHNFLVKDYYDHTEKGDSYSATELLKPVQEIILSRRHGDEIEVDSSERLWSVLGSGVHSILESEDGIEPIERLKAEIEGLTISGKPDRIKDGKIYDYKVTSAFSILYGSRLDEWRFQLSIYRWLYSKQKGIKLADKGYIVAILRDWQEPNVKEGSKYPRAPMMEVPIHLMSLEATEMWLTVKIRKIKKELQKSDQELSKCTDKDRWWNQTKRKYMKCDRYCNARAFCQQIKKQQAEEIELAEEFLV